MTAVNKENARLRIFKGVINKKQGITPDMEVGHLYHYKNDIDELAYLGALIGLNPQWIQNRLTGLAHFDLWGSPLAKARKLFKIVAKDEAEADILRFAAQVDEARNEIRREVKAEFERGHPVLQTIGYVHFASRSKGRSKGKGRKRLLPGKFYPRRVWKDVELYRYCGSGFRTEKHFPFDTIVTEVTENYAGVADDGDSLKMYIKENCNPRGGKDGNMMGKIGVGIK